MLRVLLYAILFFLIYYFIKNLIIGFRSFTSTSRDTEYKKSKKKEGNVTIDYVPKQKKRNGDDNGEYIEYEEVK